jgi:lysophospholipase L1-like esterase
MNGKIKDVDVRNILINVSLVGISVLLVFSAFELALYAGFIESESEYPQYEECHGSRYWAFHEEYGWTFNPNSVYLRQQNSNQEVNLYRINSDGFRDAHDSGSNSIVVVGDSHTAGWIVDQNQTYASILDRETPSRAINNYAVPGYGTEQELSVYSNISRSVEHDLVVVGYYPGNDMIDNVDSNQRRPKYVIRDGKLVKERGPRNQTQNTNATDASGGLGNPIRFLLDTTRTASYLKPRVRALIQQVSGRQAPTGAKLDRQKRLTRALLERLGTTAEGNGADVLVVIIPERTAINPENPAHFSPKSGRPYWNAQQQMITDVARKNDNIHSLDLTATFSAEHENGNRLYGQYNSHIDEYGHQVTARKLYDWLSTHGYIRDRRGASFSMRSQHDNRGCPA